LQSKVLLCDCTGNLHTCWSHALQYIFIDTFWNLCTAYYNPVFVWMVVRRTTMTMLIRRMRVLMAKGVLVVCNRRACRCLGTLLPGRET
jgi:hypothetical protein